MRVYPLVIGDDALFADILAVLKAKQIRNCSAFAQAHDDIYIYVSESVCVAVRAKERQQASEGEKKKKSACRTDFWPFRKRNFPSNL